MLIKSVLSVFLVLFTVIDIPGTLPVLIDMKKQGIKIQAGIATLVAGILMIAFLFFGGSILGMFGLDISSFALAGSLIIFLIGLEMILGMRFFRDSDDEHASGSVVPIAFPLLAGAGTLTTIISLKTDFGTTDIIAGIILNLVIIYGVLRSLTWFSKKMSPQVLTNLRKIFGIILLAIAIQMFKTNI